MIHFIFLTKYYRVHSVYREIPGKDRRQTDNGAPGDSVGRCVYTSLYCSSGERGVHTPVHTATRSDRLVILARGTAAWLPANNSVRRILAGPVFVFSVKVKIAFNRRRRIARARVDFAQHTTLPPSPLPVRRRIDWCARPCLCAYKSYLFSFPRALISLYSSFSIGCFGPPTHPKWTERKRSFRIFLCLLRMYNVLFGESVSPSPRPVCSPSL